jgi:hypothetical protein
MGVNILWLLLLERLWNTVGEFIGDWILHSNITMWRFSIYSKYFVRIKHRCLLQVKKALNKKNGHWRLLFRSCILHLCRFCHQLVSGVRLPCILCFIRTKDLEYIENLHSDIVIFEWRIQSPINSPTVFQSLSSKNNHRIFTPISFLFKL